MRSCVACGTLNRDEARYCQHCRAPLAACPVCGAANRARARFCQRCRAALAPCPACGTANRAGARFCQRCRGLLSGGLPAPAPQPVLPAGRHGTGMLPASTLLHGRYLIVCKVAQGGMGAIYQAADTRLAGKVWAVKEMSDAALAPNERAQAIADFQREAQILAHLDHLNLPKVADLFEEAGKHYLVMEFVDGQTLEALMNAAAGRLPPDRVLCWAEQICDVLDYLHGQQPPIIYRDLKPANVMEVRGATTVKLIDFGIARFHKGGKSKDTTIIGTPGYAPPEQYGTEQTDARSDVYALGATLYTLFTGYDPTQNPFSFPDACALNPKLSKTVEAALRIATAAQRADRFASAGEFKQALLGLLVPTPPQPATPTPGTPSPVPSATLQTPPPLSAIPTLELSRDTLDFGVAVKGQAGSTLGFQARNANGGTLSGDVTCAADWVTCTPDQITQNDQTIQVQVDTARLSLGRQRRRAPRILRTAWQIVRKGWWVWLGLWGLFLLGGINSFIAGGLGLALLLGFGLTAAGAAQLLAMQVAALATRLVPTTKHHRTQVEVKTNGGDERLVVEVTATPSAFRRRLGWSLALAVVPLEAVAVLLACWWLLTALISTG